MFEFIYEWMQNLAYYLVLVTALLHMITNAEYKKYLRFFTGIVLIVILIAPIFQMSGHLDELNHILQAEELEKKLNEIEYMQVEEKEIVVEDISIGRENISAEDER